MIFRPALIAAALLFGAVVPASAGAVESGDAYATRAQKPLILIRFNQPRVAFERQLYNVVQRAVAIKPDAVFDVVAYVPTGSGDTQDGGAKVTRSLNGMGVPESRIAFREVPSTGISDTEVHVNVR